MSYYLVFLQSKDCLTKLLTPPFQFFVAVNKQVNFFPPKTLVMCFSGSPLGPIL